MPVPPNGPTVGTDQAYGYSIPIDFPNGKVNDDLLAMQIEDSGLPGFDGIVDIDPVCNIYFTAALSGPNKAKLDVLVSQHSGTPYPIPPDVETVVAETSDVNQKAQISFTMQTDTQAVVDLTVESRCTGPATGLGGTAIVGDAFAFESTYLIKDVGGVVTVVNAIAASRPPFVSGDISQLGNTVAAGSAGPNDVTFTATQMGITNGQANLLWKLKIDVTTL